MSEASHPYIRLQTDLAELINRTPPGERLPSEPELAKKLGVSRATLREAMRAFEGQGLIRRKQGLGTFVVGQTKAMDTGLEILESIETLAERNQLEVSLGSYQVRYLSTETNPEKAIELEPGVQLLEISRVILAKDRPVAFLIDIVPEDVMTREDLNEGFTGSVLDIMLRKGAPALSHSKTEIKAVAANAEVARSLEIQRGDVLLLFDADLYTTTGRMIDHSYSYFLPGYFRFHVIRNIGYKRI